MFKKEFLVRVKERAGLVRMVQETTLHVLNGQDMQECSFRL